MKKYVLAAAGILSACGSIASAVDVFAFDVRNGDLLRFPLATPANRTFINQAMAITSFAMDFNPAATLLFAVTNPAAGAFPVLGSINQTTGVFTPLVNITGMNGDVPSDFCFAPNGTAYISSGANLYTVNPGTGVATLVGAYFGLAAAPLMIDLAVDINGLVYGHDIGSDSLILIDPSTAQCTLVGPHGLTANFAQGMDFDWATNTLYATIYTGGGTGRFVSWNTTTGAVTTLLDTGGAGWNAEMEIAIPSPFIQGQPTPPVGSGVATPNRIGPGLGDDTLLTVQVTPGTNPASTGITVRADLTVLGGSATQSFFDNGTNGDATAGDGTYSYLFDGNGSETPGVYTLPFTVADAQSRSTNGNIALRVYPPSPGNDACGSATVVGEGTFPWTLVNATSDGFASCVFGAAADVWFAYTATQNGIADINTCGQTAADTVLNVFDSNCNGIEVACLDDSCGIQTRVSFNVTAGQTFYIRVSEFPPVIDGEGTLTINVVQPQTNDNCADATPVGEGSFAFNTIGATVDAADSCTGTAADVWFLYTPTQSGCAVFDTCGSGYDTVVGHFFDCFSQANCNDDACGLQSRLIVPGAIAGQPMLIRVSGSGAGAVGTGALNIRIDASTYSSPGGTPENEPCLGNGAVDNTNGGCNSVPAVFGAIGCGETVVGNGSGFVAAGNVDSRDTDWYRFTLAEAGTVTLSGQAQFNALVGVVTANWTTCGGGAFVAGSTVNNSFDCPSFSTTVSLAAGEYVAFVAPAAFGAAANAVCGVNSEYWMSMNFGAGCGPSCDPDVNCDGVPDQDDVACIILAVAGDLTCFCQADPDFNGDGVPDQDDVAAVILTVAGAPCP